MVVHFDDCEIRNRRTFARDVDFPHRPPWNAFGFRLKKCIYNHTLCATKDESPPSFETNGDPFYNYSTRCTNFTHKHRHVLWSCLPGSKRMPCRSCRLMPATSISRTGSSGERGSCCNDGARNPCTHLHTHTHTHCDKHTHTVAQLFTETPVAGYPSG